MEIIKKFDIGEIVFHAVTGIKGQVRAYEVYSEIEVFYHVFLATGEVLTLKEYEIIKLEDFTQE